jgi:nicotinamidase-related amidase
MGQYTRPALLVIDVQKGLFEHETPIYEADRLLANIQMLIDRAHAAGTPVFYIQHSTDTVLLEGTDEWNLHPSMRPLPTDHLLRKHHGNAFEDTSLKADLDALHVGRVVIVGLLTKNCVQATCYGAHDLGYDVTLVQDGHSNYSEHAGEIIEEENEKLSREGIVHLQRAAEVSFSE